MLMTTLKVQIILSDQRICNICHYDFLSLLIASDLGVSV